jgi:hypothetical protein
MVVPETVESTEKHDTIPAPPPIPSSVPPSKPGQDAAELEDLMQVPTLPPPPAWSEDEDELTGT